MDRLGEELLSGPGLPEDEDVPLLAAVRPRRLHRFGQRRGRADDAGEGGARRFLRDLSVRWIATVPRGCAPRGVIHRGRLREPREKDFVADHVGERDGQIQEVLPELLGDVGVEELRDIHAPEEIPVLVENRRSGAERRVVGLRVMFVGRDHHRFAGDEGQARGVRPDHFLAAGTAFGEREIVEEVQHLAVPRPREDESVGIADEGTGAQLFQQSGKAANVELVQLDDFEVLLQPFLELGGRDRDRDVPFEGIQAHPTAPLPRLDNPALDPPLASPLDVLPPRGFGGRYSLGVDVRHEVPSRSGFKKVFDILPDLGMSSRKIPPADSRPDAEIGSLRCRANMTGNRFATIRQTPVVESDKHPLRFRREIYYY